MKKSMPAFVLVVITAFCTGAAGSLWAQFQPEAGFITLEPSEFYFHANSYFNRILLRSSPARIWYVYQPADVDPGSKPLFIFFNGGPGGATSCGLLAAFTGRNAVLRDQNTGEASIVPNTASWTRIGNLLHIDARNTGFSYSLMDNPGNDALRKREFDAQNYNAFIDGADFVRVVLRFLAAHTAIRANRVVLVPESYGGIRTIVMLHLLLYYENYANGLSVYQDPSLVDEVCQHYDAVFPEYRGRTAPPEVIAGQFSHQILIQTALDWPHQRSVAVEMLEAPGSPLYQVAEETGIPYVPFRSRPEANPNPTPNQIMNYVYDYLDLVERDPYICSQPSGYFNGHRAAAVSFLTHIDTLNQMIGVDASGIPEMYAAARQQAYKIKTLDASDKGVPLLFPFTTFRNEKRLLAKLQEPDIEERQIHSADEKLGQRSPADFDFSALIGPPPSQARLLADFFSASESDLAGVFGGLSAWDRFFVDLNYDVADTFAWNRATFQGYGIAYQNTLLFGRMFLENTAWVETFATNAAYDIVVFTPALPNALALSASVLSGAQYDAAGPPDAVRPGQIILSYRPSSVPGSSAASRTIRFPRYTRSGHAVTMTEPLEILEDVISWLADTGIPSAGR
jgi:hypothetical protein